MMKTLANNSLQAISSYYKNLDKSSKGPLPRMNEAMEKLEGELAASEKTLDFFESLETLSPPERLERIKADCPHYFNEVKEDVEKKIARIDKMCERSLGISLVTGSAALFLAPLVAPGLNKAAHLSLVFSPGIVLAASYIVMEGILLPYVKPRMVKKKVAQNIDKWHQEEKIRYENLQHDLKALKKTYLQEARKALVVVAEENDSDGAIIEAENYVDIDGYRLDVQA